MSNIQNTKKNDKVGDAPLRRFLVERKQNNGNTTITSTTADVECWELGVQQDSTSGSHNRSKRRPRRTLRIGAGYITDAAESRRHKRSRKSRPYRSNAKRNENNSIPRVIGHCLCGVKVEAPYFERCEDCFAEDSERWSGKPQRVIIH